MTTRQKSPQPAPRPAAASPADALSADAVVEAALARLLARHPEMRADAARHPKAFRAMVRHALAAGAADERARQLALDGVAAKLTGPHHAELIRAARQNPGATAESLALAAIGGADVAPTFFAQAEQISTDETVASILALHRFAQDVRDVVQ